MPKVSIIIPCYNQGYWLNEAVDSAIAQDFDDFDIVLVNDGSTDPISNRVFASIEHPKVSKIETHNQGLAEARNTAISSSDAEFILPLDSDDRLHPQFLSKTIPLIESNENVGIVYTNVELYGEQQGLSKTPPYSFPEVLINPQIVATALYRRSDWEESNGYQKDMIHGWEDYDFWLSIIERGKEVKHLPETLFYYRQTTGSMAGLDRGKMLYSFKKLFEHHQDLYEKNIQVLFDAVIETKPIRERRINNETFEIYIPSDKGYEARDIRSQNYPKGTWSRVVFQILSPITGQTDRLRLDPGSSLGLYDIASMKAYTPTTGEIIYVANDAQALSQVCLSGSANRIEHARLLRIFNTGSDPYFYLPDFSGFTKNEPIEIEIWVRYHTDLSELQTVPTVKPEENESLIKIRDLQEALQFKTEENQLLKYQEVSLREELQNLRNERTLFQSEINNQSAITKSIQAELFALQSSFKEKQKENEDLKQQIASTESEKTSSETKRKGWFK